MKRLISILLALFIFFTSFTITAGAAQDEEGQDLQPNEYQAVLEVGEERELYDIADIPQAEYFTSNNPEVLIVDENARLYAVSEGEADITAHTSDGKLSYHIAVINSPVSPNSISFNAGSLNLTVNQTYTLKPTPSPSNAKLNGSFSSSNKSVASVDANGKVTAHKKGTAYIYFTDESGITASCKVNVKNTSVSITLTQSSTTLIYDSRIKTGTSYQIRYKQSSSSFYKITYASSNTSVAKVSSSGLVTATGVGTTRIYVYADGLYTYLNVTVTSTSNTSLTLNEIANRAAITYSSTTRYLYGTSIQGRPLEAYIIKGNRSRSDKIIFADFACHGFEDSYYRDGQVLTAIGNKLVDYYARYPNELGSYTLVVVPCVNPDGTIAGVNNNRANSTAFGRCTADHVDMNRDFYSFEGKESRALRDLFSRYNPDVYLNFHGWLNTSIGTTWLANLSSNTLGLSRVQANQYVYNYIIGYTYRTYNAASCLVEYRSPGSAENSVDETIDFIYNIAHSNFSANPVYNGWITCGKYWRYMRYGSPAKGWLKVSGKWYWFDKDGDMMTGWRKLGNNWYYLDSSGAMVTGWRYIGGKWYYFHSSGTMRSSCWLKYKNEWYYFNASGSMRTKWLYIKGKWYYFDTDGAAHAGWKLIGDIWYFFDRTDNSMQTDFTEVYGNMYYFDENGARVESDITLDGTYYVTKNNGAIIDEISIEGTEFSFTAVSEDGILEINWDSPSTEVDGYQIILSEDESFEHSEYINIASADIHTYKVKAENTQYVKMQMYKQYNNKIVYFNSSIL